VSKEKEDEREGWREGRQLERRDGEREGGKNGAREGKGGGKQGERRERVKTCLDEGSGGCDGGGGKAVQGWWGVGSKVDFKNLHFKNKFFLHL